MEDVLIGEEKVLYKQANHERPHIGDAVAQNGIGTRSVEGCPLVYTEIYAHFQGWNTFTFE